MERNSTSDKFPIGASLPEFRLPSVDGSVIDRSYFVGAKAALIIFSCNHCPYVRGTEEMLHQIIDSFDNRGLRVALISSNDASKYPEDSFEKMREKASNQGVRFPYLYDESQAAAKKFDAACTPECYLFDQELKLAFHGAITDRPKDKGGDRADYLSPAIESVLSGQKPNPNFVNPIGCSIKWKD